eukprot:GFUD01003107.1.p1 GENE.GFUD01003107.1~~GFUD01003107.1.p1  ORF type:complete len:166 (-),score=68.75 GFUD01003107.1:207-704(-)
MSEQKKSLVEGISCMAQVGALFAGEVAGMEVVTQDPVSPAEEMELVWDDQEERNYREWLKMEMEKKEAANFSEFSAEEEYRREMREDAEQRGGDQVSWEDERERAYRLQYQNLRQKGTLVWDCSGERAAQERSRARVDARKNQPLTWDDQDERACMEMYRKKYGK